MAEQLAGKRVLCTGGNGFLGQHVCRELQKRGPALIAVPRSFDHNLNDPAQTRELFRAVRPDVVIHLAAEVGGIGANQTHPARFLFANVVMGANVVDACREFGVGKLVALGSCCAYPLTAPVPLREETIWDGYPEPTNAPYGIAKRVLLSLCQAYRQQYGLNAVYLIPANLYGPGDNFDLETSHVIPAMIRKFVEAKERGGAVTLWGDGTPTRDFLYVEDAAEAICLAAERYDEAEPVNLGGDGEISIASLAYGLAELIGFDYPIRWDGTSPNGQPRRCLDTTRARNRLGWEARTLLADGLQKTVEWYKANRTEVARCPAS